MPRAVSIFANRVFAALLIFFPSPAFPVTADTGDTLDALFAGDCAAIRTVIIPTATPLTIPAALTPNNGILTNSSPAINRSRAHTPHVTRIPRMTPAGIAILHQFRASSLTKRIICSLLIPIQRIIPKNFVLWATLLFILPAIISAPAISIKINSITAIM